MEFFLRKLLEVTMCAAAAADDDDDDNTCVKVLYSTEIRCHRKQDMIHCWA
jgi:hypothetical protein